MCDQLERLCIALGIMYLVEEICSQMCDDLANCLGKDCKDAFLV